MGAIELRNSLIKRFNEIIEDDSKLVTLDGVFDAINETESTSLVSEEHYKIVEARREEYLASEPNDISWEDVKSEIKKKYGF